MRKIGIVILKNLSILLILCGCFNLHLKQNKDNMDTHALFKVKQIQLVSLLPWGDETGQVKKYITFTPASLFSSLESDTNKSLEITPIKLNAAHQEIALMEPEQIYIFSLNENIIRQTIPLDKAGLNHKAIHYFLYDNHQKKDRVYFLYSNPEKNADFYLCCINKSGDIVWSKKMDEIHEHLISKSKELKNVKLLGTRSKNGEVSLYLHMIYPDQTFFFQLNKITQELNLIYSWNTEINHVFVNQNSIYAIIYDSAKQENVVQNINLKNKSVTIISNTDAQYLLTFPKGTDNFGNLYGISPNQSVLKMEKNGERIEELCINGVFLADNQHNLFTSYMAHNSDTILLKSYRRTDSKYPMMFTEEKTYNILLPAEMRDTSSFNLYQLIEAENLKGILNCTFIRNDTTPKYLKVAISKEEQFVTEGSLVDKGEIHGIQHCNSWEIDSNGKVYIPVRDNNFFYIIRTVDIEQK